MTTLFPGRPGVLDRPPGATRARAADRGKRQRKAVCVKGFQADPKGSKRYLACNVDERRGVPNPIVYAALPSAMSALKAPGLFQNSKDSQSIARIPQGLCMRPLARSPPAGSAPGRGKRSKPHFLLADPVLLIFSNITKHIRLTTSLRKF